MEQQMKYIIAILVFWGCFFIFFTCEYFKDIRSKIAVDSTVHDMRRSSHALTKKVVTLSRDDVLYPGIPVMRYKERITKKDFGMFVTPENSPIIPERFSGYHTGIDLEAFDGERDEDIVVRAICDGEVVRSQYVRGYGGVVVQQCQFVQEDATVIYGHLAPETLATNAQDLLYGDKVGLLGDDQSVETDGERKHLHLGVKRGTNVDFRGYVQIREVLDAWIDPCDVIDCNLE
jgi:murein DD-endopeptidase MepM/ murein hydrolase activator NlpD